MPMAKVVGVCEHVWGPYAVKLVNETTGEEHLFICEELNAKQATE